ncbi:MAG: 30S ribosomal protein S8 [Holosporaceae bacterium]|jgi:small subunit ribosomal protein S8|nr:30S ribosomal protein S8 [Holosporaceae bacterium]
MMTDPIADMLARIKNACQRRFDVVDIPTSKTKARILRVLEREGYINGTEEVETDGRAFLRVKLKYYDGRSVIKVLDRVSKPSCRSYSKLKNVSLAFNGFGIYVLSTSRGILSDAEARESNVGGEILCRVF